MIGKRFGKLTVVERVGTNPRGLAKWKCKCDCGGELVTVGAWVRSGTKSCGCLHVKHGMSRTQVYRIWRGMKSRCLDPLGSGYERYGAQGVKVHPAWVDDFAEFYKHVGPMPSPKHSLDRFPNPKGDYVPGNVRWATATEQARNRTVCKKFFIEGQLLSIPELAEKYGIKRDTIYARIKSGWSIERAVSRPVSKSSAADHN